MTHEITCSIKELFDAIEQYENIKLEPEQEYFLRNKIEIKNEENIWCNIPGIIKKKSKLIKLIFDDNSYLECSNKHLLRVKDTNCELADNIQIGQLIEKIDGSFIQLIGKEIISEETDVFDMEINSLNHLYQTSNGMVHHNTLFAQTLARFLDVPLAIGNATSITESGLKLQLVPFYSNINRIIPLIAGNSCLGQSAAKPKNGKVQRLELCS